MSEYRIPTGHRETEFTEKRSRFLGHIWRVESEEQARARIEETKKRHYDARHNCWCYRLHDSGVERYSDDGEPQGTAGQPILNVFQREQVENVLCVVTRYFGGIPLGAGGLVRAYTQSAKDTLDAAGISVVRRWVALDVVCPYPIFERVKQEIAAAQGIEGEHVYGEGVVVKALLPETEVEVFSAHIIEISAGACLPQVTGEAWRDVPVHPKL